jgi:hypothetical protein
MRVTQYTYISWYDATGDGFNLGFPEVVELYLQCPESPYGFDDVQVAKITRDYRAAINAALPDSVELANDGFSAHPDLCRSEAVRLIGEAVSAVDFYGMADELC